MRYFPPRKPALAVIYTRTGSDLPSGLTADQQEAICRKYCLANGIPISHSVRAHCDSEASLDVLRYLIRTLPEEVDTLFAVQFLIYSRQLRELGQLCLMFQCRPTWVFSLDFVQPISKMLYTITPEDHLLADQRYLELIK